MHGGKAEKVSKFCFNLDIGSNMLDVLGEECFYQCLKLVSETWLT